MKLSKNTLIVFAMLVLVAALYRLIPVRPAGFAPQMALALFGGAMIRDKKWAFTLPLLSLFLSDLLYQGMYIAGVTNIEGFYAGQWMVYGCFMLITLFGFLLKKVNVTNTAVFSVSGSLIFFVVTNFLVWAGGGGYSRPKTFDGLMMCYADALAFYRDGGLINGFAGNFIIGELFFTVLLFGGYYLVQKSTSLSRA
jgi:hypothetical protein